MTTTHPAATPTATAPAKRKPGGKRDSEWADAYANTPRAPRKPETTKRKPRGTPGACGHKTPCGDKCCLSADYGHVYHGCNDETCLDCHGASRFQMREVAAL